MQYHIYNQLILRPMAFWLGDYKYDIDLVQLCHLIKK